MQHSQISSSHVLLKSIDISNRTETMATLLHCSLKHGRGSREQQPNQPWEIARWHLNVGFLRSCSPFIQSLFRLESPLTLRGSWCIVLTTPSSRQLSRSCGLYAVTFAKSACSTCVKGRRKMLFAHSSISFTTSVWPIQRYGIKIWVTRRKVRPPSLLPQSW